MRYKFLPQWYPIFVTHANLINTRKKQILVLGHFLETRYSTWSPAFLGFEGDLCAMKGLVPGLLGSEARLKGVQMCPFYQSHRFHSTNTKNCKEEIWNVKKKHSVLSECQSSCLTMAVHLRMMDDKKSKQFSFWSFDEYNYLWGYLSQ